MRIGHLRESKTDHLRRSAFARAAAALAVFVCASISSAVTYEVGPGKAYETCSEVPWESINAGDTVLIHWRSTPYKEKWVICRQGTVSAPITVRGVANGSGELPVIDGDGATTRTQLNFWNEDRAVIKIGGASIPADTTPKYIVIENLDIKSARPPYQFTDEAGVVTTYRDNASAVYPEKGENLTIRNCILRDCGNGLINAPAVVNLTIEGCYVLGNGIKDSVFEHNTYTEANGMLYQYNRFEALRVECGGNNLKDRSAGCVIRYNWIQNGNRQLDLVDGAPYKDLPSYRKTFVYGNILIEGEGQGNRQMIHYGGDSTETANFRKGWLYLYNNTIVSYRTDRTVLLRMSSTDERADVRNNIVYTAATAGSTLALLEEMGTIDWKRNWTKPGWVETHSFPIEPNECYVNDDGTSITGTAPGFMDEAGQDFHLEEASACTNAATSLHADAAAHNVTMEYVRHQTGQARPTIGTLDIGALEGPGITIPPVAVVTASLPGGTVGSAYSQTLAGTGGMPPLSWNVESGALPDGLTLSGASITGTPSAQGSYGFTVKATDSGGVPRSDTQALSIAVSPAAPPAGDSDGDGLLDEWEILHFGDLSEDDTGDADSDGWSNIAEQDMGTDPSYDEPGPMYLAAADWQSVGLGGGGAQYNPTPAPNNPDLMYASCDMGGFYRSVDGGRHWEMVQGRYVNGVPGYRDGDCGPAFNFQDENIALCPRNGGLARTTDGGLTWTKVHTQTPQALVFHPADGTYAVFAGDDNRLYESTNGGATWAEDTGWRSIGVRVRELIIDPATPKANATIYASTAQGVYKSTNGGTSWTAKNSGLPSNDVWDLGGGVKTGTLALYCISGSSSGNKVMKSTNGGDSWTQVMTGLPANFFGDLAVAWSNADVAYVGSDYYDGGPTLHKTTNGGGQWSLCMINPNSPEKPAGMTVERTWQTVSLGWGWGGDAHQVNVCPTDPNVVALSEDGRTWRSNNGGTTWFCCNSEETSNGSNWWRSVSFEVTTCYKYVVDPRDSDRHYICYTDIGFARSEDAGATWRWSATGSPWRNTFYEIACDPTQAGRIWAAVSNSHDIPGWQKVGQDPATFTGGVVISTDWGASWTDVGHSTGLPTGAVTSIVVDPTSSQGSRTVYAVVFGQGVYKSTDGGVNWTAKNTGLTMGTANNNVYRIERTADGALYAAITHRRLSDGTRLKGGLFKSINGGDSWTLINTSYDLYYIQGFAVDPTDTNRIYAGLAHPGGGIDCASGIVRSTDGGATWSNPLSSIDAGVAWHVVPDPARPSRAWAAINAGYGDPDGEGIYLSEDYGATWTKAPTFPFTNIGGIRPCFDPADSQNIYITTYGGGVWKARVPYPTAPGAAFTATPDSGPADLEVQFDSSACTGEITTWTWDFDDGQTSHEANPVHTFTAEGTFEVRLTVEGPAGTSSVTHNVTVEPDWSSDTDDDGLPDGWEMEYFGDLDETTAGDPDGDGVNNGNEYLGGTDPTQGDSAGPLVSSVASVPNQVREGLDASVTLTAAADDSQRGNSNIAEAEYFVGADPGAGSGTAMSAADGAFDEPVEALSATVDTSAWTAGNWRLSARARDAAGRWSTVGSVLVPVVDGTAPAAVTDLAVEQAMSFEKAYGAAWQTLGSVLGEDETLTIDLGASKRVGALTITVAALPATKRFTISGSDDGTDWTMLASEYDYRFSPGTHLWVTESADYRYVRLTAKPLLDRRDRHYYVRLADVSVYEAESGSTLAATWRATADDGNDATSGAASGYDIRYSPIEITEANFASCAQATFSATPKAKGQVEEWRFSVGGLEGRVYVGLKVGDEVPNWSAMSNMARADVTGAGLAPGTPADQSSMRPDAVPQFTYSRGHEVATAQIALSDRPDFPQQAIRNDDGTTSRTIRYPLKLGVSWWKPTASQWVNIKRLASTSGAVYWRIEGKSDEYKKITTWAMRLLFDAGFVSNTAVSPSHALGPDTAAWPEAGAPLSFSWTDNTKGMKYFFVDTSTDPEMPLRDRKATVVLGGAQGAAGSPYTMTAAEWLKLRKLAAAGGGTVYWRVRALDKDKALATGSGVGKLVFDGGTWSVGALDFGAPTPSLSWAHAAQGYAGYVIQLSTDDGFDHDTRTTLRVPSQSVAGPPYVFSEQEIARVRSFAQRNGATQLYYRVRAEDANKAFAAYSPAATTGAP